MFKRDWFNGFAFGLISGFLLTPALIFAAILFGVSPDEFGQSDRQSDSGEQGRPQDARWWLIRSVVYMDDTAAQWIMTFATIFAAYLLLRTLWATQKMANDTREIGEAQVRAYVSFHPDEIDFQVPHGFETGIFDRDYPMRVTISGKLTNSGNSPAIYPQVTFAIFPVRKNENSDSSGALGHFENKPTAQTIPAGVGIKQTLSNKFQVDWSLLMSGETVVRCIVAVRYRDVFNDNARMPEISGTIEGIADALSNMRRNEDEIPNCYILWDSIEQMEE